MRRQERSRERRMVIITSPERSDGGGVEKREDLGEAERKVEARKCDRIFLSSAPIKAEMVPFQGLQGDQVSLLPSSFSPSHSSYLSHLSHMRYVEKNLLCGEIPDFYARKMWKYSLIYAVLSRNQFCRNLRIFVWRKF